MKKITQRKSFYVILFLISVTFFSCSGKNEQETSNCWKGIDNSYIYSFKKFEKTIEIPKSYSRILYKNSKNNDTLLLLYTSLKKLIRFKGFGFHNGAENSIDWYSYKKELSKKIEKLKIDLSTQGSKNGLTNTQYKSLVYYEFHEYLVDMEYSVEKNISKSRRMAHLYLSCP